MIVCSNCGKENPDDARFCMACATPFETLAAPAREVRKTVTVVFTDVTGSTALGEQLDPESLRRVMSRYFDEVRAVLERHGGTVEKFIGDAVMAVFGIPQLHEDDALRATRAAWDMGAALATLNEQLHAELGVRIVTRTGVNTGEVVAGDASAGQALVTGDAVNVAARLEQAAAPGEILLGPATYRLVRDAVEVEPTEPLTLKGKEEPVAAYRLRSVIAGAAGTARHTDSAMVGRDGELDLLRWAFSRAVEGRSSHLMTILGAAGVGKSRLVAEFLAHLDQEPAVLRGRCLPYGEGITFWPVAEAIKQAAGITNDDDAEAAAAKLAALVEGEERADLIGGRVAQVIGLAEGSALPEETFWAIRTLFESVARRRPLVLVLDDIHWAEPTLLDLIDHMADWSRDAPILLLCLARQELLELRPGWGGGKVNASIILLEPLSDQDCELLIENLLGRAGLPAEVVRRIEESAEGNPLFVEEMVGMLIDDGLLRRENGDWAAVGDLANVAVPPTIQALLAARLDHLAREERAVIEGASVVGRVFYRGAVAALSPRGVRETVTSHLATLVRRELIRPQRSELAGEDTYRFRHMLIRDSAYESMPKEARAELHERFADWLEPAVGERVREYEEILGYHLEQAWRYLHELGLSGDRGQEVGARAGRFLGSAGLRAEARGDVAGSTKLLARAVELLPADDPERLPLMTSLARSLVAAGEFTRAEEVAKQAAAEAEHLGNRAAGLEARLVSASIRLSVDTDLTFAAALEDAELILAEAKDSGDPTTLARAWHWVGQLRFWMGDSGGSVEAGRHAEEAAGEAGLERLAREVRGIEFSATVWGALPVAETEPRWEAVLAERRTRVDEMFAVAALAVIHAMKGEADRARELIAQARRRVEDLGMRLQVAAAHPPAVVYLLNGDLDAAEAVLRPGLEMLRAMGEKGFLSTSAGFLAETLYRRGHYDEAEELTRESEEAAAPDDIASQAAWRGIRAKVMARRGQFDDAIRLAREAVDMAQPTDHLLIKGSALWDLGEVLRLAGRRAEALEAVGRALAVHEEKGDLASAARTRELQRAIESDRA